MIPRQILILALLVATGCASGRQAIVVSGESLDQLGKTFVATGKQWNDLYDAKLVTADQYREWATFATWFKVAYPETVKMWKTARASHDAKGTQAVEDTIAKMAAELARLGLKLYSTLKPPGG